MLVDGSYQPLALPQPRWGAAAVVYPAAAGAELGIPLLRSGGLLSKLAHGQASAAEACAEALALRAGLILAWQVWRKTRTLPVVVVDRASGLANLSGAAPATSVQLRHCLGYVAQQLQRLLLAGLKMRVESKGFALAERPWLTRWGHGWPPDRVAKEAASMCDAPVRKFRDEILAPLLELVRTPHVGYFPTGQVAWAEWQPASLPPQPLAWFPPVPRPTRPPPVPTVCSH